MFEKCRIFQIFSKNFKKIPIFLKRSPMTWNTTCEKRHVLVLSSLLNQNPIKISAIDAQKDILSRKLSISLLLLLLNSHQWREARFLQSLLFPALESKPISPSPSLSLLLNLLLLSLSSNHHFTLSPSYAPEALLRPQPSQSTKLPKYPPTIRQTLYPRLIKVAGFAAPEPPESSLCKFYLTPFSLSDYFFEDNLNLSFFSFLGSNEGLLFMLLV